MTKRQRMLERKADWNLAIKEGRMVRYNNGQTFTPFKTAADAAQAVAVAKANGFPAEIVEPSLAQVEYIK